MKAAHALPAWRRRQLFEVMPSAPSTASDRSSSPPLCQRRARSPQTTVALGPDPPPRWRLPWPAGAVSPRRKIFLRVRLGPRQRHGPRQPLRLGGFRRRWNAIGSSGQAKPPEYGWSAAHTRCRQRRRAPRIATAGRRDRDGQQPCLSDPGQHSFWRTGPGRSVSRRCQSHCGHAIAWLRRGAAIRPSGGRHIAASRPEHRRLCRLGCRRRPSRSPARCRGRGNVW